MYGLMKSSLLGFLRSSLVQKSRAVDAAVGDAAGPDQHAVARWAAEIASSTHRAIVLPFRAPELQAQPGSWCEVGGTQVPDGSHLVGAAEQDLHARAETHLTVRRAGPAEGTPALALRVGTVPFFIFISNESWRRERKSDEKRSTVGKKHVFFVYASTDKIFYSQGLTW